MSNFNKNSISYKLENQGQSTQSAVVISQTQTQPQSKPAVVVKNQPNGIKINTHYYDGKMEGRKGELKDSLKRASEINPMTKVAAFDDLNTFINGLSEKTHNAIKCLSAIIESHKMCERQKSCPNYDPINNLFADDLLYLCYEKICVEKNTDFTLEFLIQLDGMITGLCPQGRCTRLFQILLAFSNE